MGQVAEEVWMNAEKGIVGNISVNKQEDKQPDT